jgi:aspartate/methionine/tyrosine aminotransferase
MAFKPSKRSDIPNFKALDILREVAERRGAGEDIISLAPGQPSRGAPDAALDYARKVLEGDTRQGYTEAIGMRLLRDRIAVFYRERYGINLDHSRVAVTIGSSGGFVLALTAAFDVGDTVALTAPTYPAYRNFLKSIGLKVIEIETSPKTNYQPTAELLEKSGHKFDGLIICSPSNPTGTMIDEKELEKICKWCDKNGVRLVSDEAYHGITYETAAQTALKFSDSAIVLNTFSKYFAMTGWRLGWTVLPEDLTDRFKKLAENLFVSPPTLAQHLAYKIFDHTKELDEYVAEYCRNRDILREQLPEIGFDKLAPAQGAFYLYADVHNLTNNSEDFCRRMLNETLVSMTPGTDFDLARGNGTVRISYAGPTADIIKACERLKAWKR